MMLTLRKSRFLLLAALALPALVVSLALVLSAAPKSAGPQAYVVTGNSQFGTVDLATGAFHQIGPATPGLMADLVWLNGSLYSLVTTGDDAGDLAQIKPATGQVSIVGSTGLGYDAFSLASVDGKLYLTNFNVGGNSQNIYSVNPTTGAATLIGPTGIPADASAPFTTNANGWINLCDETLFGLNGNLYATFDSFAIDPNPRDSTYLNTTTDVAPELYQIDPSTGATTDVGPADWYLDGLADVGGSFYAFKVTVISWTKFGPHAKTQLLTLDLQSGQTTPVEQDGEPVYVDSSAGGIFGAAPVQP
ncbi:MAG: hypothetical protein KGL59_03700 [Acidobacteriota bacterium]|nr:hypothetical protein [Acidobacteriota bacterium]